MKEVRITSFVALNNGVFSRNGEHFYSSQAQDSLVMLHEFYTYLSLDYAKFFKMDGLSKTAILAVEVLLKDKNLHAAYASEEMAIVMSTAHSSLDTDMRYVESMKTMPSPSLFVYTLPNVAVGEISIRNIMQGETCCFVSDEFDAEFQTEYVNGLFATGNVKSCVSGWVDFFQNKAEAFFYLAEYSSVEEYSIHSSKNLENKFQGIWKS